MDVIRLIETGERLQVAVRPRAIEEAFAALWDSARRDPAAIPATRASATNLVVAVPAEAAPQTEAILADVTARLPGRVVLLVLGGVDEAPAMEAWMSALCRLGGSGREHVCCELVTIRAAGAAIETLPTAVTPLLIGDLPATFWWRGDPAESASLTVRLADLCGRVLLDLGRSGEEGPAVLDRVRALAAEGIDVADILWIRLAPWRRALARFFDPAPARGMLRRIRSVRFTVGNRRGAVSAWMLSGWLAERLGWTARCLMDREAEFADRRGNLVRFVMEMREAAGGSGHGIESWIVVAEEADGAEIGFALVPKGDGARVEAAVLTEGTCPLPSVLEVEDPGETGAATAALESVGPDCGLVRAARSLVPRAAGGRGGIAR